MADGRDLVYVGGRRDVAAIEVASGRQVWGVRLDERLGQFQTLLVDGDLLLVGRSGQLYCFDRYSGQRLWKAALPTMKNVPIMIASAAGNSQHVLAAQVATLQQEQAG